MSSNITVTVDSQCDTTVTNFTKSIKINAAQTTQQDLINVNSHSSLCTQTQDGDVEVTWDWHSPETKIIKTFDAFNSGTPKRTTIIHNKRISNSPLMYKPLKRKLIRTENTDDIDKFKAELVALSEKLKNGQDKKFSADMLDVCKSDIPGELEFADCTNDEHDLVISINSKQSSVQVKKKSNKNFDDLFDDSLNDTMIECSQEIEKRLNIAPIKVQKEEYHTFTITRNENIHPLSSRLNRDTSEINPDKAKLCVDFQTMQFHMNSGQKLMFRKDESKSKSLKIVMHSSTTSVNSRKTETLPRIITKVREYQSVIHDQKNTDTNPQDVELHMPDDSFDEFLATCDENFEQSKIDFTSTTLKGYNKVNNSIDSMSPKEFNKLDQNVSEKFSHGRTKLISEESDMMKTNIATINVIDKKPILSGTMALNSNSIYVPNRNWKFFKSKSHSDSSFVTHHSKETRQASELTRRMDLGNIFKGVSSSSLIAKNGSSVSSSLSVSTQRKIAPIHRTSSWLDYSMMTRKSIQEVDVHKSQMNNVNRCGAKEDGKVVRRKEIFQNARDVTSGIHSLLLCSPEEIEQKRKEAKIKLEAKMKRKKSRSNSNIISPCVLLKTQNSR